MPLNLFIIIVSRNRAYLIHINRSQQKRDQNLTRTERKKIINNDVDKSAIVADDDDDDENVDQKPTYFRENQCDFRCRPNFFCAPALTCNRFTRNVFIRMNNKIRSVVFYHLSNAVRRIRLRTHYSTYMSCRCL